MNNNINEMPATYSTGWVYILENEAMPNLFKIGFTRKTVEERVAELSNHTGVALSFTCVFCCCVRNPEAVERDVHEILAFYLFSKEFFKTEFEVAEAAIRQAAAQQIGGINDAWRHSKYSVAKQPKSAKQEQPRPVSPYVRRAPYVTPGQLTSEIVHTGSASSSLVWVPLKGHPNER